MPVGCAIHLLRAGILRCELCTDIFGSWSALLTLMAHPGKGYSCKEGSSLSSEASEMVSDWIAADLKGTRQDSCERQGDNTACGLMRRNGSQGALPGSMSELPCLLPGIPLTLLA